MNSRAPQPRSRGCRPGGGRGAGRRARQVAPLRERAAAAGAHSGVRGAGASARGAHLEQKLVSRSEAVSIPAAAGGYAPSRRPPAAGAGAAGGQMGRRVGCQASAGLTAEAAAAGLGSARRPCEPPAMPPAAMQHLQHAAACGRGGGGLREASPFRACVGGRGAEQKDAVAVGPLGLAHVKFERAARHRRIHLEPAQREEGAVGGTSGQPLPRPRPQRSRRGLALAIAARPDGAARPHLNT